MFCANCGHQNPDTGKFCEACGSLLAASPVRTSAPPSETAQPFQPAQTFQPGMPNYQTAQTFQPYPPQQPYAANQPITAASPVPQGTAPFSAQPVKKKSHLALILILISLALVAIAAAIGLVVLVPYLQNSTATTAIADKVSNSLTGYWSSEELNEVLKFKDNGKVYHYTADGTGKGSFSFSDQKSEGVITIDGTDYPFTLDEDTIDVEDKGTFVREAGNFDPDDFLDESLSGTETVVDTTDSTDTTASRESGVTESVTDETISLSFSFGSRTGTYTGDLVDGIPQGYGTFTTTNTDGYEWTYDGEWVDGHMSGNGSTTWEDGYYEIGVYVDDSMNGYGQKSYLGIVYFEGDIVNDVPEGQGTLYNDHGEIVFSGEFSGGFIRETAEERNARVGAFKDQSIPCTRDDLYTACESNSSVRAQTTGTIFQVYDYVEGETYSIGYLIYEQGYTDADHIVQVYYNLSEGETVFAEGDTITVWGTTEYNEAYTSIDGTDVTAPTLEAWSVEAYQP